MKKTLLTFIFLFAFVVSSFGQSTTKEVSVQESDGSPRYKVSTIQVPAGALTEGVMKDGNKLDLSNSIFDSINVDLVDINGGTLDAVTIGAAYPAQVTVTAMVAESVSVTYGVTGTALYQTDELGAIQASIIDGKAVFDAVSPTFLNADSGTIDNATIENSNITGADSIQADKGVLTITNEAGYSLFISFPVTATADVYIRVDENGKVQKENR